MAWQLSSLIISCLAGEVLPILPGREDDAARDALPGRLYCRVRGFGHFKYARRHNLTLAFSLHVRVAFIVAD